MHSKDRRTKPNGGERGGTITGNHREDRPALGWTCPARELSLGRVGGDQSGKEKGLAGQKEQSNENVQWES